SARANVTAPTEIGSGAYGAFLGEVSEILLFNRALTEAEVLGAQQFLASKYALPIRYVPHTNFALDQDGEVLRLSRPDGSVADEIPSVEVPRDVAYGRQPDG